MATPQAVYKLATFSRDPRFERFLIPRGTDIPNFYLPTFPIRKWKPPILAPTWKPVKLVGRIWKGNDFPCAGSLGIPVLSPKAVATLRDLLESDGEILPVETPRGEYYAFNITRLSDALDRRRSEIDWFKKPTVIHQIY